MRRFLPVALAVATVIAFGLAGLLSFPWGGIPR